MKLLLGCMRSHVCSYMHSHTRIRREAKETMIVEPLKTQKTINIKNQMEISPKKREKKNYLVAPFQLKGK